ncbi:Fap1p Ecym_3327 [Eremothecium cymbalariae DBVPG|uniref:R3H domain-containing protein n=1 Tax=Eremothecium cymbalariae (strain CBS 270.75 / DBVPG 7215 / KCTC 17166 / NRRL Y-17582) TaxID=931890 RepID=G8JRP8_ERECY|nr:Hypothetical protein Ecym_3327 [Eremothecium cymbalariae DBVPG\
MLNTSERSSEVEEVSYSDYLSEADDDGLPYYEKAIKDIQNGYLYQCLICTVEIDSTCRMYACSNCYRVYDYECIMEWAKKSSKRSADSTWKCPNCYHSYNKVLPKKRSTCWCGKQINPEKNATYPNSCGQTCGASICKHGCASTCHLGPHPKCMVPVGLKCKCGKITEQISCYQTKAVKPKLSCKLPCGLPLPCGVHTCQKICHSGPCGRCNTVMSGKFKCYCGSNHLDSIICKDVAVTKMSRSGKHKKWIGVFSCKNIREVRYRCKEHSFNESCKPSPSPDARIQCPYSPNICKTCCCGNTTLIDMQQKREKCTDPIPTCDQRCGKPLSCGKHTCPMTCHPGKCMDPCLQIEERKCSCQERTFLTPCQFDGKPSCNIKCENLMSCRRHRCIKRCCSGKPLALARSSTITPWLDKNDESLIEAEHICFKNCNRKLSCGLHHCTNKCHPGKCPPCLESDSNDLVCPCGKSVILAPVRCGTVRPNCNYPCINTLRGSMPCGHRAPFHKCHPSTEDCPPCTAFVYKPCKCGKLTAARTICFQNDISCGRKCAAKLTNCHHLCQKQCHPPGECPNTCTEVCGLKRSACEHLCTANCHGDEICPDVPCLEEVVVSCGCGRRSLKVPCGAYKDKESATATQSLLCDDDCAKVQKHQMLLQTLRSSESTNKAEHGSSSVINKPTSYEDLGLPYSEQMMCVFSKQATWCKNIQDSLIRLLEDKSRKSLHFKPMKAPQRQFVHELSKAFGLYSESQDREPKRSVFVKILKTSKIPAIGLSEALLLYQRMKTFQKERRDLELQHNTTKILISIPIDDGSDSKTLEASCNAILITGVPRTVTVENIKACFDECLKQTLLKDPQFRLINSNAYIYPSNFLEISANVETDIQRLVPYFSHVCERKQIGYNVSAHKLTADFNKTSQALNNSFISTEDPDF